MLRKKLSKEKLKDRREKQKQSDNNKLLSKNNSKVYWNLKLNQKLKSNLINKKLNNKNPNKTSKNKPWTNKMKKNTTGNSVQKGNVKSMRCLSKRRLKVILTRKASTMMALTGSVTISKAMIAWD